MKKRAVILFILVLQLGILGFFLSRELGISIDLGAISPLNPFQQQEKPDWPLIKIAISNPVDDWSPLMSNESSRVVLKNVYEPLVDFDAHLRIMPRLATSWGKVNPTTWEFTLREGVVFHDQDHFDADDVVASFEKVRQAGNSEIREFLENIERIEKIDAFHIRIVIKHSDPLFLAKIRRIFILSDKQKDEQDELDAAGTGPFVVVAKDDSTIELRKFPQYYLASDVHVEKLRFLILPNKFGRLESLKKQEADIIFDIPVREAEALLSPQQGKKTQYTTITVPTLESVFILFNTRGVTADPNLRRYLYSGLDRKKIQEALVGSGTLASQFASSGVFGFFPDLLKSSLPKSEQVWPTRVFATLQVSPRNEGLGEIIAEAMEALNIKVDLNTANDDELLEKMKNGNGDMFIVGWKFSDGDVADFFDGVVHRPREGLGIYNGLGIGSDETDQWIEQARSEEDAKKRLKTLQSIMQKTQETDLIGIPLFEYNTTYAYRADLPFYPSLDGTIGYRNLQN